MLVIDRVVQNPPFHTDVTKGEGQKMKVEPKEFKFGNTTVIIHSPLAHMTPEEQKEWFDREWERGNPVLRNIAATIFSMKPSS